MWEGRPWLVSPNLTPDRETGAGAWTDDMFARAIREGIGHDGRVLHPQMWYGSFRSLSDEDLASVIVYLRSLDPVSNPLPATKLPAGREPLVAPEPLDGPVPLPDQSTPIARGAYLVRVADCQGCHTAWEAPLIPGLFGGGNQSRDAGAAGCLQCESHIRAVRHRFVLRRSLVPRSPARRRTQGKDARPGHAVERLPEHDGLRPRRGLRVPEIASSCESRRLEHRRAHPVSDLRRRCTASAIATNRRKWIRSRSIRGRFATTRVVFRFADGFTVEISNDGKNLRVQFDGGGPIITIVQLRTGEFTALEIPDYFTFRRDANGRVTALVTNVDEVGVRVR